MKTVETLRDVSEAWPKTGDLLFPAPSEEEVQTPEWSKLAKACLTIGSGGSVPQADVAALLYYIADMAE